MSQLALSQSMHYSTLQVGLKQWALSGLTGRFRWSVSVGNFYVTSKAATTPLPTLIPILQQSPNWTKSRTVTMPTTILHFYHKRRKVLGSLDLKNVIFFNTCTLRSFGADDFDRSHFGTVFSKPKKKKTDHP